MWIFLMTIKNESGPIHILMSPYQFLILEVFLANQNLMKIALSYLVIPFWYFVQGVNVSTNHSWASVDFHGFAVADKQPDSWHQSTTNTELPQR